MSIKEDAARLRNTPLPFGPIQQAMQDLDTAKGTAMSILGEGATGYNAVASAIEQAKLALDTAFSMVQEVEHQINDAANRHSQG